MTGVLDLNVLDTIGTPEYLKGNLSDSGSSFRMRVP